MYWDYNSIKIDIFITSSPNTSNVFEEQLMKTNFRLIQGLTRLNIQWDVFLVMISLKWTVL